MGEAVDKIREKVTVQKQNDTQNPVYELKNEQIVNCLWEFRCGRSRKRKL